MESVSPKFWGPGLWNFLYSISFSYNSSKPEEENNVKTFLHSLGEILPCEQCKQHYKEYLIKNPINLKDSTSLEKWINDLHNTIRKNNSQESVNIDDVKKKAYELNKETIVPIVSVSSVPKNISLPIHSTPSFSIQKTSNRSQLSRGVVRSLNPQAPKTGGCNCGKKK